MRMMAKITVPVEAGNQAIANGSLPQIIGQAAERWKPGAMYFATFDGNRTAFIVFDMTDSADLPVFSEPFFTGVNATVELSPVMNIEDLQKGLGQLNG